MSSDVGRRCGLDLAWLWCRPAAAAPIHPLDWEIAYVARAAVKKKKRKKERKKERKKKKKGPKKFKKQTQFLLIF